MLGFVHSPVSPALSCLLCKAIFYSSQYPAANCCCVSVTISSQRVQVMLRTLECTRSCCSLSAGVDDVVSCLFALSEALTAMESDGTLLMEQYVPCHICAAARPEQREGSERAEDAQYFNMEDCVLTAIELDYITCPNHPDIPVSLQELVPELFMTDFPAR